MPCSLQVSINEASMAQFSAPSSEPAKSAFFLLRATGRMLRSTVLESISMRPSSRKCSVSGASVPSRSALDGSGRFGGPGPGQQFAEAAVGPVIDKLGQHVSQVGMRIDAMQFAGLDQRGEHGPVFCPFVRTSEECVFSVESNWAPAALDSIGVDLDAAIVEEAHQPLPLIEAVANGFGGR